MSVVRRPTYSKNEVTTWAMPNYWDVVALLLVATILIIVAWGARAMMGHYELGQQLSISLNPIWLPYYALRSFLRMLVALLFSTVVTFLVGSLAAKSRHAERVIIPMVDILQSVPVLGYLSFTIVGFLVLFKGSLLGPECASIFVIFTAQVWNMILSFYQSVRTVPHDMIEASQMFHLSAWQRFWKVEVPFSMPGLLWNAMMSMSSSWVFLVASEAISVAHQEILLPGLGSYIAVANQQADSMAILQAIIMMFIVIAIYDQLIFRPLVAWAEKFKLDEHGAEDHPESWLLNLFQRTQFFLWIGHGLSVIGEWVVNARLTTPSFYKKPTTWAWYYQRMVVWAWNISLLVLMGLACHIIWQFVFSSVTYQDAIHVVFLGAATATRVLVLIVVSSIIWVPVGVWIGLSPNASRIAQPIAQFLAAFPANVLFSVTAPFIIAYHLNVNIWVSPLMILGTQWYILFNVIAGVSAIPKNLYQAVGTLSVSGWLWWRRLILPGIFPYFVTGVVTAAGGAWNISIVAEVVNWGQTHIQAYGLGAFITTMTQSGNFPKITLGIVVMSGYVLLINRLLWRPLYNLAEKRFQLR